MTNEVNITIWGRDFELPVRFDCFENETITAKQKQALETLLLSSYLIENSKQKVENYCKEQVDSDDANTQKSNIFSYIKPLYIYVTRDEPHAKVSIMCNYRYDLEHGLAVTFLQDRSIIVSDQDSIL